MCEQCRRSTASLRPEGTVVKVVCWSERERQSGGGGGGGN